MEAFCSNCGEEVRSNDPIGKGTEAYQCSACGTYGTIARKTNRPSSLIGEKDAPTLASLSLNLLDILKLDVNPDRARCPRCGNYSSGRGGGCPSCDAQTP